MRFLVQAPGGYGLTPLRVPDLSIIHIYLYEKSLMHLIEEWAWRSFHYERIQENHG